MEPCKQGCSWMIRFSHCLNFSLLENVNMVLFFQFEIKMAVHSARLKKKMCIVKNF